VSVEDQVIEGDRVANLWRARGTHRGNLGGIPATEKQMETSGITMFRIAGGKVFESWEFADMMGMMKQLGVVPVPGQPG
jgi:predicted ester cyclase